MNQAPHVAIVGATGAVGVEILSCLETRNFPVGSLKLLASARSAGKQVAFRGKMLTVEELTEKSFDGGDIARFSAGGGISLKFAPIAAAAGCVVIDNSSAFRLDPNVPLIVPEINPEHFEVIEHQKKRLGTTRGFIAVKPNCSIQSYAPVLTAWKEFEPYEVVATTYQAISGAGKTFKDWPEMIDNVIPYIAGEEEKSEQEPLRIWGHVENGQIVKAEGPVITTQCIRVPVQDGHTAAVFMTFEEGKKPSKEEIIRVWREFSGMPQELGLPNAPKHFIQYLEEDNRPQVSLDVNYENGFGVSLGRLREDTVFDYKFVGLSHNTVRGAAGGAVLIAELLKAKGYITAK